MPVRVGDIELHVGPQEVGGPDDLRGAIVGFIDGAKKKLDIAVQELDSMDIAEAIVHARQRKVRVRLVVEGDYLKTEKVLADPFQAGGKNEVNREIQNVILRTAVDVRSDYNSKIFHQKFIVRDGSALLTGSTNFTDTGTSTNLNHVVIVRSRKVANLYTREYREIQQGHFGKLNEGHDEKPADVTVSNVPIRVLFAPDHNPEMEIMKQMMKSRSRIDFAMFTFARSSGIDDTMITLCKDAGREIRGVLDNRQANQDWAATKGLVGAGVKLWTATPKNGLRKLHHKLMVIDEQVVIAGSFNYTGPATQLNDENIIILGDLEITKKSTINAQKKLATYALDEIDRIITKFGKRAKKG
jgi:phosphatidylserine/phosphatidylglycerophosphate/cardiolipin synthase-like enzyme